MQTIDSLEARLTEPPDSSGSLRIAERRATDLARDAIALAKSLQARLDSNDASFTEMYAWYIKGDWGLPLETSSQQNLENCTNFLIALGIALQIRVDDIAAQKGEEDK